MAEFKMDLTPYVREALMQVDAITEERVKKHLEKAFQAGRTLGYEEGLYAGSALGCSDDQYQFEEWLKFYEREVKRDGVRSQEG